MPSNRIGSAFVEIATKGFNTVKNQLNTLRGTFTSAASSVATSVNALGDNIQKFGTLASRAFFLAKGGMLALVRTADPVGFERLKGTFGAIAVQLGSIFIPVVDALNAKLQILLNWLRSLSDEQKDQILRWVEIGTAILGVVAVAGKLASIFNPWVSLAIALAGAVGLMSGEFNSLSPILAGLKKFWDDLVVAIQPAIDSLKLVWDAFLQAFQSIWEAMQPVFTAIMDIIATVAEFFATYLAPAIATVVGFIASVIKSLVPVFVAVFGFIKSLVESIIKALIYIGVLAGEVLKGNFSGAVDAADAAVDAFDKKLRAKEADRRNKPGKPGKPGTETAGRHTPLAQNKPEFVSLIDAWRRAMTAQPGTLNSADRERNLLMGKNNDLLQRNNDLMAKQLEKTKQGKPQVATYGA